MECRPAAACRDRCPDIPEHGKVLGRIDARGSSHQFGQQRHGGPRDPHIVHGFVVAAFRADDVGGVENIGQTPRYRVRPGCAALIASRIPLDRSRCKSRQRKISQAVVVVGEFAGVGEVGSRQHSRRAILQFTGYPVLQRTIEAAVAEKPIEGQRPTGVVEPRPRRPSAAGEMLCAHFCQGAIGEAGLPRQAPRQGPAFHILRWPPSGCVACL